MNDFDVVRAAMNEGIPGMTTLNASGHQALGSIEAEYRSMSEQLTSLAREGHYPTEGTSA